jgi:2-dehydro-3-deoxygalactonokinase
MAGPFLACDWGTTNLRAWRVGEDGRVEASRDIPIGVSKLQPGEAEHRFRDEVRPALEATDLPAELCGMVGSNLGWLIAPYLEAPLDLDGLAAGMVTPPGEPRVRIAPGVRCQGIAGAPDVMRGEETQVFGWLALDPTRSKGRHVVCHPGTHAKWVLVEDGRIVRFVTAMTGELYWVLSRHGVLTTDSRPDDAKAFGEGVAAAGDGDALSARLFSARSRVVAGNADPASAASYLSGLLIGSEVAVLPRLLRSDGVDRVVLLGDPGLTRWYAEAIASRGFDADQFSGDEAALAGLGALHERMRP